MVKNALRKDPFTGTVFVFYGRGADRPKLLYCWDEEEDQGAVRRTVSRTNGLVMADKRREHSFTWPAVKDGLMGMIHTQFEALFGELDWRRMRAVNARAPEAEG